jgi:modulator of FtsH protease
MSNETRAVPVQSRTGTAPAGVSRAGYSDAAGKVLRNTYALLSLTLLFSAAMAGVSMALNAPYGLSLVCSLVALGLLWFVLPRAGHSMAGIYVVFAVTGLLGFGLGPVLNMYLRGFANGGQLIMMAFGMTGAVFIGLSMYAVRSRRDFSFMGGFLASGIMIAFVLSIGLLVASMLGYHFQPLALGVSAMFSLLMCGLILYQTGEIVNGGETSYVLATVTLYVSIYNLFTSLLHLIGFSAGED